MPIEIIVGVELELEYNQALLGRIGRASYHGAPTRETMFGMSFVAETDGSLSREEFENGDTAEIVSVPFLLSDYKMHLNRFENQMYRRIALREMLAAGQIQELTRIGNNGRIVRYYAVTREGEDLAGENMEDLTSVSVSDKAITAAKAEHGLSDFLCFNNSTGAHVHVSLTSIAETQPARATEIEFRGRMYRFPGKLIPIRSAATFAFLKGFTEALKARVARDMPDVYPMWHIDLRRSYASEIANLNQALSERRSEWNLTESTEHMEYRSFHLRGIKTWEDFYKIWGCFFSELASYIKAELVKPQALFAENDIPTEIDPPTNYMDNLASLGIGEPIYICEARRDLPAELGESFNIRQANLRHRWNIGLANASRRSTLTERISNT